MQSKNKSAPTSADRHHIATIKAMNCIVCDDSAPSEAHEPEQGMWWISIPLCSACHRGSGGWHGTRDRWKNHKMTELKAINETIGRILG